VSDVAKALATQLANIEKRTGRSLAELAKFVEASGLEKHGELVAMLKKDLGMGHGDANTLVHHVKSAGTPGPAAASPDAALEAIYAGPKAALRQIHEALMKEIGKFGDFEIAPKKTYVSLRRSKQFAIVQPATRTRVDLGLNLKGADPTERLEGGDVFGGMCTHRVRLESPADVDAQVMSWLRQAYDQA